MNQEYDNGLLRQARSTSVGSQSSSRSRTDATGLQQTGLQKIKSFFLASPTQFRPLIKALRERASKMAQRVNVVATNPEDFCLTPGTQRVDGET